MKNHDRFYFKYGTLGSYISISDDDWYYISIDYQGIFLEPGIMIIDKKSSYIDLDQTHLRIIGVDEI